MPRLRWECPQVVMFKKKVYIGGGQVSPEMLKQTVVVYDPSQDSYDTLTRYACKWFYMAVVNNQLVLVGGMDVHTCNVTNKLGVWNEKSKRWIHPLPPMTTARYSPSVATHNNRWLVVIGGYDDKHHLSKVEILDIIEPKQWYYAVSLPQPCAYTVPATIGYVLSLGWLH